MKNHARKHVGTSRVLGYRTPSRHIAQQQYKRGPKQGGMNIPLDRYTAMK